MSHQERSSPNAEFTDRAEAVMSRLDQRLHLLESNPDGAERKVRTAAGETEEFARAAAEEVTSKLNRRTSMMSLDPPDVDTPATTGERDASAGPRHDVAGAESDGDEPESVESDGEVSSFRPETVEELQRRRADNGLIDD